MANFVFWGGGRGGRRRRAAASPFHCCAVPTPINLMRDVLAHTATRFQLPPTSSLHFHSADDGAEILTVSPSLWKTAAEQPLPNRTRVENALAVLGWATASDHIWARLDLLLLEPLDLTLASVFGDARELGITLQDETTLDTHGPPERAGPAAPLPVFSMALKSVREFFRMLEITSHSPAPVTVEMLEAALRRNYIFHPSIVGHWVRALLLKSPT